MVALASGVCRLSAFISLSRCSVIRAAILRPVFMVSPGATTAVDQTTQARFMLIFQQHNKNSCTRQPFQSSNSQANPAQGGSVARLAAEAVIRLGCTYAPAVSGRRILPVSSCCIMPCFKARALSSFWVNACSSLSISDKRVAMAVCSSNDG